MSARDDYPDLAALAEQKIYATFLTVGQARAALDEIDSLRAADADLAGPCSCGSSYCDERRGGL